MLLPDFHAKVLYRNAVYQVRDRSRNKLNKTVTLWLCDCSDLNCQHTLRPAPVYAVELYPEIGDLVVVAAKPYCDWIRQRAKKVRGHNQYPSWEHSQLMESLDDLCWMVIVFTLRMINVSSHWGDMAVIKGDGERREVPLNCLKVLEKRQHSLKNTTQEAA